MASCRPCLRHFFVVVLLWAVCSKQGWSQALPSSADPARQAPALKNQEDDFSRIYEGTQVPKAQAPALSKDAESISFVLNSVVLEGATAFSPSDYHKTYAAYLGREITLGQLIGVMTSIQQMYYDSGYTLTKVLFPAQDIQNGNIHFEVVEGYVAEVDVDSNLMSANILDSFKSEVLSMRPLNTKRLERLMLLLNDRPGLNVSSILSSVEKPAVYERGAIRLSLKSNVHMRVKNNFVEFNNHGSNFSGPGQMIVGAGLDKGLPNYSNFFATYTQTTSAREMRQAGLSYDLPLAGVSGTVLHVTGGATYTQPGDSLDSLDIKGTSKDIGISISYPLIRQRDKTWQIEAGFDYKNTKTNILDDRLSEDRIRSLVLKTKYSFSDKFFGINVADVKYSQGLDVLDSRPSGSQDLSREAGKSDYKKIEASFSRLQSLSDSLDVFATLRGQYTQDPLLSSAEFGYGGETLGRGYDPSEIAGDKGVAVSLEARYKGTAQFYNVPAQYQLYAFYDFGKIWNIDPLAKNRISTASAGVGTRLFVSDQYAMDFNIAFPLTKSADNPPKYSSSDGPRALLSLKYSF